VNFSHIPKFEILGHDSCVPLATFEFSHSLLSLFSQHLSRGSVGTLALQVELTEAREVATVAEAAEVAVVHVAETSAQEAAAVKESAAIHGRDAKDRATLAEREAQERELSVEVENIMALASAHKDTEALV
jgi:hypothetical protein